MNQHELCLEAQVLMDNLKNRMWKAAFAIEQQEYFKLERVYLIAARRYDRRYRSLYPERCHPDLPA